MDFYLYIIMIFLGFITGGITSLVGASAVLLVVPVLNIIFHFDTFTAIGTSLLVDVIASSSVAYSYYKNGNTNLKAAIWITIGSILGSQLGVIGVKWIPENNLNSLVGYSTALIGIFMIIKAYRKKDEFKEKLNLIMQLKKEWHIITVSIIIGIMIGIICGLFGAGGGIIILLVLTILLKFSMHQAIGTSTVIMCITAASASIGYGIKGNINYITAIIVGLFAIIGGFFGSRYANKIDDKLLQKITGFLFIVLGIIMTILRVIGYTAVA